MSARTIVAELYERFTAGDIAGVSVLLSSDVDWDEGDGHPYGRHRGFAAVSANVFERLGVEWEGMATHIEEIVEDPSGRVVVLGRDIAVNKATGRKIDSRVAHVYMVRDGKIVAFLQFCDTAAWRHAMPTESS